MRERAAPPRREAPGKWQSMGLAIAVHVGLFLFLFIGIRWQSPPPAALEVGLASMPARSAPAAAQPAKAAEPARAGYGKEQRRRRAELRAKIKACEDEMEACGAREVELDNEINSPEVYNDPQLLREKSDELADLRFHQEELFAAWEKAMEEQEQYEQSSTEE